MNKTYLFINATDFTSPKLTGAHRRFLELVRGIARENRVILVSGKVPALEGVKSIEHYDIRMPRMKWLPSHIRAMIALCAALRKLRKRITYDYAVSFGTNHTVCYRLSGYRRVVSLFREDLIEYLKAIGAPGYKLLYFKWQERTAVKASDRIIVQCRSDRDNLILRNKRRVPGIEKRIYLQINNVNPTWSKHVERTYVDYNHPPHILFVGNFSDGRKGHAQLLPAMARLADEGISFSLDIVGDGQELDRYKADYSMYPGFIFHGYLKNTDMNALLARIDIVIVPSLIDSCPNTVMEGLNVDAVVYGSNRGGIPDILVKSDYLFEPESDSIYSFLKDILQTRRYIVDSMAQKKRREALTFDWAQRIESLIEG